jgi:sensor histidine kinase YesM
VGIGLASAAPGVVLGVGVNRVVARWPSLAQSGALPIHVLAAATFSGAWCAAIITQVSIFASRDAVTDFLRNGLVWQFVMGIIVYGVLAGLVNIRLARQREREHASVLERSETLRLRAELNALRARLDPHFLFNALQTLGALVTDRPADAHRALELLATLLRRRLDHVSEESDLASLADELADARDYLALGALSLGERLRVTEDVADDTLPLLLPRFSIQPLVENAIRHGIGPRASGGAITIRARRVDHESWRLEIADDGVGIHGSPAQAGRGVGAGGVAERVRLHFGPVATVRAESPSGVGYVMSLTLPALTDGDAVTSEVARVG